MLCVSAKKFAAKRKEHEAIFMNPCRPDIFGSELTLYAGNEKDAGQGNSSPPQT
jgi:hypothetical protein